MTFTVAWLAADQVQSTIGWDPSVCGSAYLNHDGLHIRDIQETLPLKHCNLGSFLHIIPLYSVHTLPP